MSYMGWILIIVLHGTKGDALTMQEFNGNIACEVAAKEVLRISPGATYSCVPKGLLPVAGK